MLVLFLNSYITFKLNEPFFKKTKTKKQQKTPVSVLVSATYLGEKK